MHTKFRWGSGQLRKHPLERPRRMDLT